MRPRRATALLVAGLAAAATVAPPAAAGHRPPAEPAPAALAGPAARATLPLGKRGRWITDARGRVVILHGVNVVNKLAPYHPGAWGFGADDARLLARNGFNTVRLGVIYKGVEPRRGRFDRRYVDRVAATARMLGRYGIHVLVDFHQDLYNERFSGEGFPDWAVQDDGLPAQPDVGFPGNMFLMPALWRAFEHFWANDPAPDGVGLQDAYARAWRYVAARMRGVRGVFGYDVMNEPWPGSTWASCVNPLGCPLFDRLTLTPFFTRVFEEIRKADRRSLVFYETHPVFGAGADVHIEDTGDPRAGFSFHLYCLGALNPPPVVPTEAACPLGVDRPFVNAEAQSERTGDALLLTEFGATDDLASIRRDVDAADRHMVGWQYWAYFNRDPSGERPHEGILHDPGKPPTGTNVKQEKLDVLVRPYPRAIAGVPVSWSFDPDREDRRFELVYRANPRIRAPTEVFVPAGRHYGGRYRVQVSGPARVVSRPDAPLLLLRATGAGEVHVTVTR